MSWRDLWSTRKEAKHYSDDEIMDRFGQIVHNQDVAGFGEMFLQANSWEGREFLMSGLRYLVEACENDDDKTTELRGVLASIARVCRQDPAGGTYRENCLVAAEFWVDRLTPALVV